MNKTKAAIVVLALLAAGAIIVIVIMASIWGVERRDRSSLTADPSLTDPGKTEEEPELKSKTGSYRYAAVADDIDVCSQVGTYIMLGKGGSAVDAAIAVGLCNGVINQHNSGIGGGFIMIVHDKKKGNSEKTTEVLVARESGPQYSTPELLDTIETSVHGAMNIAVPGEVYGYEVAHKAYGRLPWADLFQPAIDLAKNGFSVERIMDTGIKDNGEVMRTLNNTLTHFLTKEDGSFVKEGDQLVDAMLAKTLERIAHNGYQDFYNGSLAQDIVDDIRDEGGRLSVEDLQKVRPPWFATPLRYELAGRKTLVSAPPPASGALIGMALKVLNGYNYTREAIEKDEDLALFFHRFSEAFKYLGARREFLADSKDPVAVEFLRKFEDPQYAAAIRRLVTDDSVQTEYGVEVEDRLHLDDHSTSHYSVYGPDGSMVSLTTTVGSVFGCKIKGKRTGIVFNNNMSLFTKKSANNITVNYASPNQNPRSATSPVMLLEGDRPVLAVGGSGGTRIFPAVTQIIMMNQVFERDIAAAVDMPRVFSPDLSSKLYYDKGIPKKVLSELKRRGHILHETHERYPYLAVAQAIDTTDCALDSTLRTEPCVIAVSDYRKQGKPDGF